MADSLKIQNLSLNESQHAPNGPPAANGGRAAYIPPHLRGRSNVNAGPSPMDGAGPGPGPAGHAGPAPGGAWGNG